MATTTSSLPGATGVLPACQWDSATKVSCVSSHRRWQCWRCCNSQWKAVSRIQDRWQRCYSDCTSERVKKKRGWGKRSPSVKMEIALALPEAHFLVTCEKISSLSLGLSGLLSLQWKLWLHAGCPRWQPGWWGVALAPEVSSWLAGQGDSHKRKLALPVVHSLPG